MTDLQGKTAVVTGASRGIGRAIALRLAAGGADIALIYAAGEAAAKETAAEVEKTGHTARCYRCNVASFAETAETTAKIIEDFGGVDILVNNAGMVRDGLVLSMKEEDFDDVVNVNLKGAFNMVKHLYRHFMRRPGARIINIGSVVGISGNGGQVNYAAAKAGLSGLTKSVAKELASRAVTCNTIAPGYIVTDMTDTLADDVKNGILANIPAKRMGTPEDVAALAAFLASDAASYITGETIRVDGGMCM